MSGDESGLRDAAAMSPAPPWWVFRDSGAHRSPSDEALPELPPAPPWRSFGPSADCEPLDIPVPADSREVDRKLGARRAGTLDHAVIDVINAAIQLRRPLLVTGQPGTGKSSLAYQIAAELGLGRVLWWPVVSRTTLRDGLYDYDAIGRVQDAPAGPGPDGPHRPLPDVSSYLTLGPLGTALLPWKRPRVLLVDELDKSDIDLPNDLLHIFEEGEFRIRELERLGRSRRKVSVGTADHGAPATVRDGRVRCVEFPLVVITSNGERAFSPAFRRRCLEIELAAPDERRLAAMIESHFGTGLDERTVELVRSFLERRGDGSLAADQLLNTVHMLTNGAADADEASWERLRASLWRNLASDTAP
ncbi:MoxR family ATPase [Streptomyces sp. Caat 7-52]|uniref:AAA family ATPase n=1 Tax=Streptomyces sp. Caat 7-52 TaxID=2949637 RepID=UPI0020351A80|nr:MoxR family ATPase [Streptomyces sp. Caat 7-52]